MSHRRTVAHQYAPKNRPARLLSLCKSATAYAERSPDEDSVMVMMPDKSVVGNDCSGNCSVLGFSTRTIDESSDMEPKPWSFQRAPVWLTE